MKKKICILLAMVLMLSVLAAIPTFADAVKDDGTNSELEAQGYVGITTAEELMQRTGKLYLKNDIVFASGVGGNKTETIIDGNGHTVYFNGGASLINWGKNVGIRNLNLAGEFAVDAEFFNSQDHAHYGPLCIHGIDGDLVVENVHSSVDITVYDENVTGSIGGIMGKSHATNSCWINVSYDGKLDTGSGEMTNSSAEMRTIGGIAGISGANLFASNVFVDAEIVVGNTNVGAVGGLFGTIRPGDNTIEHSAFNGTLTVTSELGEECGIGGIVGSTSIIGSVITSFRGVSNFGSVTANNAKSLAYVGGIAGVANGGNGITSFEKVVNEGAVTGTAVAGGITGKLFSEKQVDAEPKDDFIDISYQCVKNTGAVTAPLAAGGIVGKAEINSVVAFESTVNTAMITATDETNGRAAGMLADLITELENSVYVSHIFNTGVISGAYSAPIFDIDEAFIHEDCGDAFYSNTYSEKYFGDNAIKSDIEALIDEIDFVAANTYYLSVAITALEGLIESDYTVESWQNACDAIYKGELLLSDDATQEEIDAAITAINDALAALEYKPIDRTELDKYLEKAATLNKDDYRGDTLKTLMSALELANSDFVKQSEVDNAASVLANVIELLRCNCEASLLPDLLIECREIKQGNYSDISWFNFMTALQVAELVTEHDDKLAAYQLLQAAKNNLADVSELEDLLAKLPENRAEYSNDENFWKAVDQVTELAESIIMNADEPQDYIDELCAKIENLINELKLKEIIGSESYSDMQNAWSDFVSQNGADSPFANVNNGCGASVGASVIILSTVISLGACITLKKKED